jgi:DNA-binding LacI/PurR family transcriptional regulator
LYYQVVNSAPPPKYRRVLNYLKDAIAEGRYGVGHKLPSEAELGESFQASRLTVNRALRELQLAGLIDRRVGSGSYVVDGSPQRHTFGLLIPDLGQTEIFEPICRGMAEAQLPEPHVLLWGRSPAGHGDVETLTLDTARQWLSKKVSGVFFAPLELTADMDSVNHRVAELFERAGIPLVLIDRDLVSYPDRSRHDLVGIDNRRAGYVLTLHLIDGGCRRLAFVGKHKSAPSCTARSAGFKDAIQDAGLQLHPNAVCHEMNPTDKSEVRRLLDAVRPDAIVCSNDFTAAQLMRSLTDLGVSVPEDVRLGGFDDVKYSSLLPVPLTTIHQPCGDIGTAAIQTMFERLKSPTLPPRDVLLNFRLIVRESSGEGSRSSSRSTATVS